ncbi:chemotaxis protein CheA [Alkalihalobacillus alcalophilus ATCC 27647 = CGMCC 1.3604]|uniref:Chemotaxis protein CheA n=1 Tax=Alkalihalobacillus alcalophilus ATCC 27647 = CGMCC 1.3604 TaxID=1218173 RepID=A0A094YV10_ALKAL|nr:chemotaxis protein CheA [Alkalihalobacillus alcalophilus]KGA97347.1 chemotaxis protein CheA [Alkalihalobacillus alcalophilus ATCC 27647 = CGMCC 1.3604]MED1560914.1 chemotaxis protein CheA [Alkalihalobacillus alcalophilus]THG90386.1 chemotaxis protein CheA [Alkalihalobacillus alcalophilus ATCC 27647 = CGMCC 1.3604]
MINAEYLDVFLDESQEHLQSLNDNLLLLEKSPNDLAIVGEIFRSAHTLKGMAATMGFEDLAQLTHNMENVLDLIRNEKLTVTTNVLDVVFAAIDDLEHMVTSISEGGDGKRDVRLMNQRLEQVVNGEEAVTNEIHNEVAATAELIEGSSDLQESFDEFERTVLLQSIEQNYAVYVMKVTLDEQTMLKAARVFMVFEVLEQYGEVIKANPSTELLEEEKFDHYFQVTFIAKATIEQVKERILNISEIKDVDFVTLTEQHLKQYDEKKTSEPLVETKEEVLAEEANSSSQKVIKKADSNKTIRVNIERLDKLMNLFEELVIDRGRLEQISNELKNTELNDTVERMSRISIDLQEIILTMRMMPVEQVFNRFPRMLRNLSKELNKEVNLEIIGADTELDRTIIDEVGDPLVHLLRNSIDHGIETPEERRRLGKPEVGTITLRAFHSGNHVFIEIEDDGAGIDRDKVIQKALKNGVIKEADIESMNDQQVYTLLFSSGFSTADKITDISGRGVGLDVVRTTFESLGGSVTVNSTLGQGSIFSIQLPLTLSIIDVMLVELGKEKYAVPLTSIVETAIVNKTDIYTVHNQKVIDFRGKVVPLIFLRDVFHVTEEAIEEDFYSLIIVQKGSKVAGLVVDSLIGQHDVVLKSLGKYLTNIFAISGATILGDGQVALIVDSNALIK